MEDDDDDFTFPTAVPEERGDGAAAMAPAVRVPGSAAPGATSSSRLWPFAAPLIGATTTTAAGVKEDEDEVEAPAASTTRTEEEERATVVDDDEDWMDMLWDDDNAASTKSGARAKPEPHPAAAAAAKPEKEDALDDERAAAVAEQERMDLLWESFNEELFLLRQRARSKAPGDGNQAPGPPEPDWYLCPSSASDADESEVSSPGRARYGCAPTMLRASSRAGGAGQFYGSPRRRQGGGWALLLRLFRRLFSAGDKAAPRRQSVYVP